MAALVAALVFGAGWMTRGWRDASQREDDLRDQAAAQAREDARRQGVALAYTERLTQIEASYASVPAWWVWFVAERGVLRDLDVGPVGLCIWSSWNAATSAESCTAGAPGPGVAGAAERATGTPDGQP